MLALSDVGLLLSRSAPIEMLRVGRGVAASQVGGCKLGRGSVGGCRLGRGADCRSTWLAALLGFAD